LSTVCSCHTSKPFGQIDLLVTRRVRKTKLGNSLPPYSKNAKPMQISKILLDTAHGKSQLQKESGLNVDSKYVYI